jgi:hypothetical protein
MAGLTPAVPRITVRAAGDHFKMSNRPEIELTLEPFAAGIMPLSLVNMGGSTCPPFSFVAILRGQEGYIRPVKFDSSLDMKPGDRFRFELKMNTNEQLTVKFDKNVELFFKDQPVDGNMISFPKT